MVMMSCTKNYDYPVCYPDLFKPLCLGMDKYNVEKVLQQEFYWNDSTPNGRNGFWQYYILGHKIKINKIMFQVNITLCFKKGKLIWFSASFYPINASFDISKKEFQNFYSQCSKQRKSSKYTEKVYAGEEREAHALFYAVFVTEFESSVQ
jgi:hypothetical protein